MKVSAVKFICVKTFSGKAVIHWPI